nr:sphingosine-1-phosphate phosphatase 2-like [Ciona intestinalis]|eukprot:XP_002129202.1 sphingosine-1-phosphate phosphatase 2-like [Ciona intestinalis]
MNIVSTLNSPVPIAKFQYICGVRWTNPDPKNVIYPNGDLGKEKGYIVMRKSFYWLATAGSELAGECFYYIFFPSCAWVFNLGVARRSLLFLSTSMLLGQSLKDVLKLPRPSSPPVIRLEATYETEYGMPSTHTIAAIAVSFSLLLFTSDIYKINYASGLTAATMWSLIVMLSRIYLGMHSLLDIAAGASFVGFLLSVLPRAIYWFDSTQLASSHLPTCVFGACTIFVSWLVFQLDSKVDKKTGEARWNTARGDTAEILGWCLGFMVGSRYSILNGILPKTSISTLTQSFKLPSYNMLVRFLVGGTLLGTSTLLCRKFLFHTFSYLNGYHKLDKAEAKKKLWVEFPYKFLTTLFSGLLGTTVVPHVLQSFNLW